jgi:hypothetical protein
MWIIPLNFVVSHKLGSRLLLVSSERLHHCRQRLLGHSTSHHERVFAQFHTTSIVCVAGCHEKGFCWKKARRSHNAATIWCACEVGKNCAKVIVVVLFMWYLQVWSILFVNKLCRRDYFVKGKFNFYALHDICSHSLMHSKFPSFGNTQTVTNVRILCTRIAMDSLSIENDENERIRDAYVRLYNAVHTANQFMVSWQSVRVVSARIGSGVCARSRRWRTLTTGSSGCCFGSRWGVRRAAHARRFRKHTSQRA